MSIVRGYNPIWSFVDLVGKQLDDTYWFFTLENTLPYLPQNVWQDESQSVVWSNPIQFLANGTLPDNIYYDDTKVYRLEIRKGNTQADALIYEVNNYKPDANSGVTPSTGNTSSDNQITNPQFGTLNFTGSLVISTATTIEFAPGWSITTTGAGTCTLSQATFTGNSHTAGNATNPSTGLNIVNNGFTQVTLFQRFNGNGALWTSNDDDNIGVAMNVSLSTLVPASIVGSISYNTGDDYPVITVTNPSTALTDYPGARAIPKSSNSSQPASAWTQVNFKLTGSTTFTLTSIQVIGQQNAEEVTYIQTTPQRQVDEEFNYYNPLLQFKPINSYLVGWDFPLNPAQFSSASSSRAVAPKAIGANKAYYAWDQTILFQTADSGIAVGNLSDLNLTANNDTKMAVVQYLGSAQAFEIFRQLLINKLSVNIRASSTVQQNLNVSLWWTADASLPSVTSNNVFFTALDANGHPSSVSGTWHEILRPNYPGQANVTSLTGVTDMGLSGWSDSTAYLTGTWFAIVIGTNTVTAGNNIDFQSISLVPGSIPTIPAPKTADEVLRECQFYYEKSYQTGDIAGTATLSNAMTLLMHSDGTGGVNAFVWSSSFEIRYNTLKFTTVAPVLYSTDGTINNVMAHLYTQNGGTFTDLPANCIVANFWAAVPGVKSTFYVPNTETVLVQTLANTTAYNTGNIQFHWIDDSRLGTF